MDEYSRLMTKSEKEEAKEKNLEFTLKIISHYEWDFKDPEYGDPCGDMSRTITEGYNFFIEMYQDINKAASDLSERLGFFLKKIKEAHSLWGWGTITLTMRMEREFDMINYERGTETAEWTYTGDFHYTEDVILKPFHMTSDYKRDLDNYEEYKKQGLLNDDKIKQIKEEFRWMGKYDHDYDLYKDVLSIRDRLNSYPEYAKKHIWSFDIQEDSLNKVSKMIVKTFARD